MPKPVAITYGVSRNELMFHEVPASSEVTFKHDSGKVGSISVTGGSLSAAEIINELQWIIPGNHQWDLTPTEDGAFKTIFPSKADLARMTKIIKVPVPGTSMFLNFEEWSAAELDRFYVTPVWVRVHGVCYKERCDYLSLFGVGSLIGKTKEVDMLFTRAHTTVRMLVEVTRVEHIPTTTVDHMYDGQGYGLIFKLESDLTKIKEDVLMSDAPSSDDATNDEVKGKETPKGKDQPSSGGANSTSLPNQDPPVHNSQQHTSAKGCSLPVFKVGQIDCDWADIGDVKSWSASKVSSLVPRKLWSDCDEEDEDGLPSPLPPLNVNSVIAMKRETHVTNAAVKLIMMPTVSVCSAETTLGLSAEETTEMLQPIAMEARETSSMGFSSDAVHRSNGKPEDFSPAAVSAFSHGPEDNPHVTYDTTSPEIASSTPKVVSSGYKANTGIGTGVFLGGRCSVDKVVAFGGVAPPVMGSRSSKRIMHQSDADATQMERAQNLAKAKDGPAFLGYSLGYPLDPYVVLSPAGGCAPRHGYWVQPVGDGSSGFLQPVRLAY
nr:uncharacterized protein LOC127336947 [Lolium perenne]